MRNKRVFILFLLLITFLNLQFMFSADFWRQTEKILADNGNNIDYFGYSVDIEGDYAAVGAIYHDNRKGSVYIYHRDESNEWIKNDEITGSDTDTFDEFGNSVAIYDELLVVGAHYNDGSDLFSGAAYIFEYNGSNWVEIQKLLPDNSSNDDRFGNAVAMNENFIFVAASHDDELGVNAGAVYIFEYDGSSWQQIDKLFASGGTAGDDFGASIALYEDILVVGAIGDDQAATNAGAAYIFEYNGTDWIQVDKLLGSDLGSSDNFGYSVAVREDIIVVGAKTHDADYTNTGAAYVFEYDGTNWSETSKLVASDRSENDRFGFALGIDDEYIAVSTIEYNIDHRGAIYFFKYDGTDWIEVTKATAFDGEMEDQFGYSIAMEDNIIITGSIGEDEQAVDAGAVYILEGPWYFSEILESSDIAFNDHFGGAVSVDDKILIAGAPIKDNYVGAAYIFEETESGWVEQAKLVASGLPADDRFGYKVDISEYTAVIGAMWNDDMGTDAGAACIFEYDGTSWNEIIKLTGSTTASGDNFSSSVAISGNRVIVGAYNNDEVTTNAGAAYIFEKIGGVWQETCKLLASDAAFQGRFGCSVAIDGNTAVVGARNNGAYGSNSGAVYVFEYDGSTWQETAKLLPSTGNVLDYFAWSIDINDNRIIVGKPYDDDIGIDAGAVYIFEYNGSTWQETTKLIADDGVNDDQFGRSVSIYQDHIIIGAYNCDNGAGINSGAAYLFEYNGSTWEQKIKLYPENANPTDCFGYSVYINKDLIAVGSQGFNGSGADGGGVFTYGSNFDNSIWQFDEKEIASDANFDDFYGSSVSIYDNYAVVGAYCDDELAYNAGAVYVLINDGYNWTEMAKLTAGIGNNGDMFGKSVEIYEDRIVIGAYGDNDNGMSAGAAYIFEFDGTSWQEITKLTASDGQDFDQFGYSVGIYEDTVIIGAFGDDDSGSLSGSVYIFKEVTPGNWQEITKLTAYDGQAEDRFGSSVAIDNNIVVIGSPSDDDGDTQSGSAYIFEYDGSSWQFIDKLTADNASSNNYFGISVDIYDDLIVVGAYKSKNNNGAVYVFELDGTWTQEQELNAGDYDYCKYFGWSVAIQSDQIIVGAYYNNYAGLNSGAAYIFGLNEGFSWEQQDFLKPDDGEDGDYFGFSVDIFGDNSVIGTPHDNFDKGSVYIINKP